MTGEDGGAPIGQVAGLIVGRVSTPEDCEEWIAAARSMTVRQLRERARRARTADQVPSASESAQIAEPELDSWDAEHVTLRFSVPPAVGAAIEEARDLHRAVVGGEASVAEFVEGLVGESFAGAVAPMVNEGWIGARPTPTTREIAMERKGEGWTFLHVALEGEELCAARDTLERTVRCIREVELQSCSADSSIRALIRLENEIEMRVGELLCLMGESGSWRGLCFAGVGHYAEERLGLSRSVAQARAHLARVFRERHALREACMRGTLGLEAASLVARVLGQTGSAGASVCANPDGAGGGEDAPARPGSDGRRDPERALASFPDRAADGAMRRLEAAWVERAEESTIKRLREEAVIVAGNAVLGSGPHPCAPLDDETVQHARARRPGRAMERLGRLTDAVCLSPSATQVVRFRLPLDLAAMLRSAVGAERRRLIGACGSDRARAWSSDGQSRGFSGSASEWVACEPAATSSEGSSAEEGSDPGHGAPGALRAALMFSKRFGVVPEWCALFALIEAFVATWDDPRCCPRRAADEVYARDGYRCSAPGCTSRRNLEEHHIEYRSHGGDDSLPNRVTLCRFHHQQGEHEGRMRCRGRAPLGILWSMGRLGVGGLFRNERSIDVARARRKTSARSAAPTELVQFQLMREPLAAWTGSA